MTDQISVPTVFMRGGTSKGLLFDKRDLPSEEKEISKYLLDSFFFKTKMELNPF